MFLQQKALIKYINQCCLLFSCVFLLFSLFCQTKLGSTPLSLIFRLRFRCSIMAQTYPPPRPGWERRNAAAAPELKSPRARMSLLIYKGKWGKMAEKNYILCTGNGGCLWVRMFLASLAPLEIGYRSLSLSRSSSSGVGREEKKRNWCRKEEVGYRRVWLLLLLLLFPPFALGGYRDGRGKGIENKFRNTSKRLTILRYVCIKRSVFLVKVF